MRVLIGLLVLGAANVEACRRAPDHWPTTAIALAVCLAAAGVHIGGKMDDQKVITAMIMFGGSFASALGQAAQRADYMNLERIKAAFPHLWAQYTELAERSR